MKEEKEEVGGSSGQRTDNPGAPDPRGRHGIAGGTGRGAHAAYSASNRAPARAPARLSFAAGSAQDGRQAAAPSQVSAEEGRRALPGAHRQARPAPLGSGQRKQEEKRICV